MYVVSKEDPVQLEVSEQLPHGVEDAVTPALDVQGQHPLLLFLFLLSWHWEHVGTEG